MIFAFYSYKGGVGRSMALANVAELFYQAGLKVLMVDWDLEAPGLERFFPVDLEEVLDRPGVMDMLLGYKKHIAQELLVSDDDIASLPFDKPDQFALDMNPAVSGKGRLWLLTAGKRSKEHFMEYAYAVRTFDWQDFYQNWEGELYFEWLRQQFERMADVVLIDSRTGITEIGGVCTYQLADTVVMFCTANDQSLQGTYEMARNFKGPEVHRLRGGRPLNLLIVPSRIERAESDLLDEFQEDFFELFETFVPQTEGIDISQLWQLGIPYIPKYAFMDAVAVRGSIRASDQDIANAYRKFSQIMGHLAGLQVEAVEHPIVARRGVRNNLDRPPYIRFIERYTSEGKNYKDDIILPALRMGRAWIISIRGEPGTGKSSLAYAVAEKCVEEADKLLLPFEAVIWLPCRPEEFEVGRDVVRVHSSPTDMQRILEIIGLTFGHREVLQSSGQEKRSIVEGLLREHTCLLLIDGLDSEWLPGVVLSEIEDFIRGLPSSHKAIVTMRRAQFWEGQHSIELETMGEEELRELMLQETRGMAQFAESEFKQVYERTHGNPLALKQALSLTRIFGYSLDEALDFEKFSPQMLVFMYRKAYERLSTNAKRVLVTMPLFVDTAPAEALEYASGISGPENVRAIGVLYRGHMIEKAHGGQVQEERYILLPFAREFLRQVRRDPGARIDDTPVADFLEQAYSRLAIYYHGVLQQLKNRIDSMLLFLTTDRQNVLTLMEWCWTNDKQKLTDYFDAVGIPLGILRYLRHRKLWGERVVEACRELGQPERADWFLVRDVAWSLVRMGTEKTRQDALRLLEEARKRAEAEGWTHNLALILRHLGRLAMDDEDYDTAQEYLERSLSLWEDLDDDFWKNSTMRAMADVMRRKKRFDEAERIYRELVRNYSRMGDINGKILSEATLSLTAAERGNFDEARRLSDTSVELASTIPYPSFALAYASQCRSEVERACGDSEKAEARDRETIAVYADLGMSHLADQLKEEIERL